MTYPLVALYHRPMLLMRSVLPCYNAAEVKDELMEILVCPVCKGDLELTVSERDETEIVSGSLYCKVCDFHYPIEDTIPNLLPPDMQR